MHLFVISKLPEFTEDGEVIPGQCEPYTTGWRLRLMENGREEELLRGTYYELRRVQRRCAGKTPEEARRLAAESRDALRKAVRPSPVPGETEEATQILGVEEVRRAMDEMEAAASAGETGLYSDWFEFSDHGGVRVAVVRDSGDAVSADEIGRVLNAAFSSAAGGLVVDLAGFSSGSPAHARVLRDLAERARFEARFLGIVALGDALRTAASEVGCTELLDVHADVESAVAAATEAGGLDVD